MKMLGSRQGSGEPPDRDGGIGDDRPARSGGGAGSGGGSRGSSGGAPAKKKPDDFDDDIPF
jgi:hypothetical protein